VAKAVKTPAREMKRFQALQRAHAVLQEEQLMWTDGVRGRVVRVYRPKAGTHRWWYLAVVLDQCSRGFWRGGSAGSATRDKPAPCSRWSSVGDDHWPG